MHIQIHFACFYVIFLFVLLFTYFTNSLYFYWLLGQLIGEEEIYVKEVICSRELCGLILVLSNGKAAFVASQSAHYEPSSLHGVWIHCVDNATCASVNARYKMAAFGRTRYLI